MSLRTVAGETPRWPRSATAFEPTGSLVRTKPSTIARSTSSRRSSSIGAPPDRSSNALALLVLSAKCIAGGRAEPPSAHTHLSSFGVRRSLRCAARRGPGDRRMRQQCAQQGHLHQQGRRDLQADRRRGGQGQGAAEGQPPATATYLRHVGQPDRHRTHQAPQARQTQGRRRAARRPALARGRRDRHLCATPRPPPPRASRRPPTPSSARPRASSPTSAPACTTTASPSAAPDRCLGGEAADDEVGEQAALAGEDEPAVHPGEQALLRPARRRARGSSSSSSASASPARSRTSQHAAARSGGRAGPSSSRAAAGLWPDASRAAYAAGWRTFHQRTPLSRVADEAVRARTDAPPAAVAPVAEVVPAFGAGTRPVADLVPAVAGSRQQLVGHLVAGGEHVVVGRLDLAAVAPAGRAASPPRRRGRTR